MNERFKIGIKNFRIFNELTEFELAPITILTGTNNSGKSSLLKWLRLLNNAFAHDLFHMLNFTATDVNIKGFNRAVNYDNKSKEIIFEFENWVFTYLENPQNEMNAILDNLIYRDNSGEILFEYDSFLIQSFLTGGAFDLYIYLNKFLDKNLTYSPSQNFNEELEKVRKIIEKYDIKLEYYKMQVYKEQGIKPGYPSKAIEEKHTRLKRNDPSEIEIIENFLSKSQNVSLLTQNEFEQLHRFIFSIVKWVFKKSFQLTEFASNFPFEFQFVDAFRGTSIHNINSSDISHPLSILGQSYLRSFSKESTSYNNKNESYIGTGEVYEKLSYWLNHFGIGKSVKIEFDNNTSSLILNVERNRQSNTLAELGFGSSQLLPIILLISMFPAFKPKLIIEEPESHLHPNLQSLLADLFLDYQKNNGSLLIETHSEYLIRRFQYLVAKGELDPKNIKIYYFNDIESLKGNEKQIKELSIRRDGLMDDDFGEGFFDESTRLTIDLLKMQNRN